MATSCMSAVLLDMSADWSADNGFSDGTTCSTKQKMDTILLIDDYD